MVRQVDRKVEEVESAYAQGEERPLRSYAAMTAAYLTVVGGLGAYLDRTGRLPERLELGDLVLAAIATHKISRTVAKAPVTSPLRAPFTRYKGVSGPSQLEEEVRGEGARQALGEFIACPFCLSQWVATGLIFGLILAPRATRLTASIFAAVAASDLLQFAYARAQQAA
ncbi:MAG: DUF1360 domain-containing protein [Actinomycetota bacterium]|nr:DUF1360 domain-containing protein [Actinomycetota bacterium]